ncbi:MAG: AAA family ATPase [Parvularculaceae bacterium]|nr:AAA family ATPase [Parvularculaceae bacterium]
MTTEAIDSSLNLNWLPADASDARRGIIRVPRSSMVALGIASGDIVCVTASQSVYGRAMPCRQGQAAVLLDDTCRDLAGLSAEQQVELTKAKTASATSVLLEIQDTRTAKILGLKKLFRQHLQDRPVHPGEDLRISLMGSRQVVAKVKSVQPSASNAALMVTDNTQIDVRVAGQAAGPSKISYEDLGGLDHELSRIREMIEAPLQHADLFQQLGIAPPKGVLLTGPPGTGKTLLAKAVAEESGAAFLHIAGPEVASKHFGESEKQLREIFEKAQSKAPSIVFIDEIDAIAPKRGTLSGEKQVERRMVAQLLTLLDGLESRGQVVVMAATNLPDSLDPALRRPGRFDREVRFQPPNAEGRFQILSVHTRGMPLAEDVNLAAIAAETYGFVGADLAALAREAGMHAFRRVMAGDHPEPDLSLVTVRLKDFVQAKADIRPTALRELMTDRPSVTFADVGGHQEAKAALEEAIVLPLKYPDIVAAQGIEPLRGILLGGPPGTGKTLLAKALAGEAGAHFISIQGSQVVSQFFGEAEKTISEVFSTAQMSSPCIVFIDEVDALAPRRGADVSSMDRVVGQLLTELDGMQGRSNVIFLAATNRIDVVDPAILRPGRIDRIIEVGLPKLEDRQSILSVHLQNATIADDVDLMDLAGLTDGLSGADLAGLIRTAQLSALRRALSAAQGGEEHQVEPITPQDLTAALAAIKVGRAS